MNFHPMVSAMFGSDWTRLYRFEEIARMESKCHKEPQTAKARVSSSSDTLVGKAESSNLLMRRY